MTEGAEYKKEPSLTHVGGKEENGNAGDSPAEVATPRSKDSSRDKENGKEKKKFGFLGLFKKKDKKDKKDGDSSKSETKKTHSDHTGTDNKQPDGASTPKEHKEPKEKEGEDKNEEKKDDKKVVPVSAITVHNYHVV